MEIRSYCQLLIMRIVVFWTVLAVVEAISCLFPVLKWSPELIDWKAKGKYFHYVGPRHAFNMFYVDEKYDTNSKEVLVALHGYPTAGFDWYKLLSCWKPLFSRVIIPDFLGMGFTDKPQFHKYTIFEHADMTERLLRHLGIQQIHLICHDIGDPIGQEILHRFNERRKTNKQGLVIKSVCLTNGAILPEMLHPTLLEKLMLVKIFEPISRVVVHYCVYLSGIKVLFAKNHLPEAQDFIDWWMMTIFNGGQNIMALVHNFYREQKRYRSRLLGALQANTVPVHIIYGRLDPVNPYPFEVEIKKKLPKASVDVFPDNGHYIQWENATGVCLSYTKFFKSL